MDPLAGLPEGTRIRYQDAVKHLPVPSWDQCERFARYLSSAHSWYKLPVDRERPFSLFLDPAAGCEMVWRENRPFRPVETTTEAVPMYGWQTTRQYRERFGFWTYHQTPEEWTPDPPEVWLLDGTRIPLPDDWKNAGVALLDAFVYPDSPLTYIGGWGRFSKEKWPSDDISDRMQLCLSERLARRPHRLKDLLEAQIPTHFRTVLEPPDIRGTFGRPAYDWPDEHWKRQLLDLQVPQAHWSPLCKYFELLAHEQWLGTLFGKLPPSPDFPDTGSSRWL